MPITEQYADGGEELKMMERPNDHNGLTDSIKKLGIVNVIDYELESAKEENHTLGTAVRIANDLGQLSTDINTELLGQRYNLLEADKEMASAANESNEALKEVKKKAKGKWTWFPFKFGFFSSAGGAVVGGVTASIPGAVIGGVGGAIGGGVLGNKIKKGVHKDVDKVEGQNANMLESGIFEDNLPTNPLPDYKKVDSNESTREV